jgi:hypothetical protein
LPQAFQCFESGDEFSERRRGGAAMCREAGKPQNEPLFKQVASVIRPGRK